MRAILVAMIFALSLNGCGFIFVNGPPDGQENMNYFNCTESQVGPILDGVWAGLNASGAVLAATNPDEYQNSGTIIASGLIWTGVSGAAAIVGQNKISDFREAKRALAQRQAGSEPDSAGG